MIDRVARNRVVSIIRSYLKEEIMAFRFADDLDETAGKTEDRTVRVIVDELLHFYDDPMDHKIIASREEWDCFHRLLLILESDAELDTDSVCEWSLRQLIAACGLVVFGALALWLGWGSQLLVLSMPFGLVSMPLWYWRRRAMPRFNAIEIALTPFSSFSQLLAVRRQVSHFSKT